jgi:flavin reductase (DIM6/NTAB) family NADH-FMN oxidoreductase RutF
MDLDPQAISQADRYKLMIGAIVPRPIAWVSTISPDGRLNLAPFSFFSGVGSEPMALLFCPANKGDGEPKDTLKNAAPSVGVTGLSGTGEFVVNMVSADMGPRMSATAEPLPYGESEFEFAGLTPAPSSAVKPPRVAEAPLAFECRTMQVLRLAPGVPDGGNIVIGRVVRIHARDGLVNARNHVDPALLDAIGRLGGASYCTTRDRFEIPRGRDALKP